MSECEMIGAPIKNSIGLKNMAFLRLALAIYMDSTNGTCCYCTHKYIDVDDVMARNPRLVDVKELNIVACSKCYFKNRKNNFDCRIEIKNER